MVLRQQMNDKST